jgi:hypothetical protein
MANNQPKFNGVNLRYLILCGNKIIKINAKAWVIIIALYGKITTDQS